MLFGGFVSDEEKKSSMKFGLNQNCKLVKFEYNPAIEFRNGDTGEGVEAELSINGSPMKFLIFPPKKVYFKDQEITNPAHPEFRKAITELKKRIFHMAKCFTTEEALIEAVAVPKTFGDFMNSVIETFEDGWQDKNLDVFLQYQWQLREGAERKYFEIPKKTSQGSFMISSQEGDYSEIRIVDDKAMLNGKEIATVENNKFNFNGNDYSVKKNVALMYIGSKGNVHPFTKTKWFMENGWGQADDGADSTLSGWE